MRRRDFLLAPALLLGLPVRAAGADAPGRYESVARGRRLAFPRDHGGHAGFRTEWWYVTGALDAPDRDIGFQLTFFRVRNLDAERLAAPLAAHQILFAHAALSRPGKGLLHAERAARDRLGAGFATGDCDVHVGSWQMRRSGAGAEERFALRARDAAFAFDFSLTPSQPLLLQGEDGWSQKGPDPALASHYVSWPQLRVSGNLSVDGRTRAARGVAWFDHEWSSEVLGAGSVGWDWLGINLDDGGALTVFRIRDNSGNTVYAHASLRDAAGRMQRFGVGEVRFTPLRHWRSPRNGATYPVEFDLTVGPHRLRSKPLLDDQEITTHRPAPISYWEGLVRTDGTLRGRGYLELTGYAAPQRL